jgi:hypothetical protein
LKIIVDGVAYTSPQRFDWKQGTWHTLEVPAQQELDGACYEFGRWNDDGQSAHMIAVSPELTIYTANFIPKGRFDVASGKILFDDSKRSQESKTSDRPGPGSVDSRRDWRTGKFIALEIYTPETLPLRRIEAIGDSVAECISELETRGLDPMHFEFTRLVPPY